MEEPTVKRVEVRPFFFFTLVTVPRRFLNLNLSDTRVYEPQIRARLGTTCTEGKTVAEEPNAQRVEVRPIGVPRL